ncbi:sugar ABC transporter ATP-binding protein [Halalkalibacterium ligniniphilum]|uniref:sugar ABC transporter ATP-binding protein n=1 Tax=Halalkalibacterium ligniniphilum TaxID=1134413 RepID=UPI00034AC530|nr:sugar ABC transporter ATP-binding protein [Halalkalibacterium ligniniphilum]
MSQPFLSMTNIQKSFNKINVLNNVNFEVEKGEVHALMGGNGAGKSTLMKILTGVYTSDGGTITIDGKEVQLNNPNDASAAGVSMIFQEFSLVPKLTVAQNIYLHREPRNRFGFIDDKKMIEDSQKILNELDLHFSPTDYVEDISVGFWQMTEIAKAISNDTKILIMDEPTSTLTQSETEVLFQMIEKLKASGITIIYISHRMDEIFRVCDRITVLRNGTNVVTDYCKNMNMEEVINHIVGGKLKKAFEWEERQVNRSGAPLLKVENLKAGTRVENASFQLYRGEILGVAGLMGSGRSEMARALFGIDKIDEGEITINEQKVTIQNPQDAIRQGIALVPEDRRVQGLILGHSVKENMILPILSKVSKNGFIQEKRANEIVNDYVKKLNVKTDHIFKQISLLSGGNQQKVVLSKWLANDPDILILDEPTSGVDIGAKSEIIELIREIAESGKAVIVISSEMTELLAISDRILIMKNGVVTDSIERREIATEEDVERAIQNV